jgi:hypothetical protein
MSIIASIPAVEFDGEHPKAKSRGTDNKEESPAVRWRAAPSKFGVVE